MVQQENNLLEGYEKVILNSEQDVAGLVKKYFKEKAWIYAVLDYAVGFGSFEGDRFLLRLGSQKEPCLLEWKYLQELRVFNTYGELRLSPLEQQWVGRFRGCIPSGENENVELEEYFVDERQKLWGKAKESKIVEGLCWSLLTSGRGAKIWVPMEMREREEAAICVRKFLRAPSMDHPELVYQTDMRMVNFCLWKEDNVNGGRYKYGEDI